MAEEIPKPTQQQAVEYLVRLGRALHSYAFPRSPLGLARNLLPHEANRLKEEIAECEKVISTAACDPNHRNLRSVLDVRRDLIPNSLDIRIVAYIAWHSLTAEPSGTSVAVVSVAAGMGSVEDMIQVRHSVRNMLVSRIGVLVLQDQTELVPGEKLVRLLSGENKLPIFYSEATLKEAFEAGQRMKAANMRKGFSLPATNQAPSAPLPPANIPMPGNLDSPKAIFNALRQTVLGMDESDTLRRFSVAMSIHLRRASQLRLGRSVKIPCQTILLAGQSGVGKTFIIEQFCKIAGLPYTIGNLAECTSSGYVGIDISDILAGLFRNGAKRAEDVIGGIVCFDEADKRKINDRNGDYDCTGSGLQGELLRILEGSDIQIGGRRSNVMGGRVMLSTESFAFCLAGCFSQVTQILESQSRPGTRHPLGFGGGIETAPPSPDIREALTTYFLPELCNRISTIIYVKPPGLNSLRQIALAPQGILSRTNEFLASLGFTLKPDEQAIMEICAYAHSSKTYARGIRSLLQTLAENGIYDEWKGELVIGAGDVRKAIEGLKPCEVGQT